jgi:hypothetical protein
MPARRPLLAALACLALAPIAACGDSGASDEDQIKDTVSGFYTAFAEGKGDTACGFMSANAKAQLLKSTKALGVTTCAKGIEAAAGFLPAKLSNQIKSLKATDVKVDGDKATANPEPKITNAKLLLVKEDGDWKLDTDTTVK